MGIRTRLAAVSRASTCRHFVSDSQFCLFAVVEDSSGPMFLGMIGSWPQCLQRSKQDTDNSAARSSNSMRAGPMEYSCHIEKQLYTFLFLDLLGFLKEASFRLSR